MGYSEVVCHICGVGFNISRLRTDAEGRDAAWHNSGDGPWPFVFLCDPAELECSKRSGCVLVRREEWPGFRRVGGQSPSTSSNADQDDDDDVDVDVDPYGVEIEAALLDDDGDDGLEDEDDSDGGDDNGSRWSARQLGGESLNRNVRNHTHDRNHLYDCDLSASPDGPSTVRGSDEDFKVPRTSGPNVGIRSINEKFVDYGGYLSDGDHSSDKNYEPLEETSDYDSYEWDSACESSGQSSDADEDASETASDILYRDFNAELKRALPSNNTFYEYIQHRASHRPQDLKSIELWGELEHIAGPQCHSRKGYNGHNISAEAMRGCNTWQCLARKPETWIREADDEDFEVTGDFFLTGLSDHMPSRDGGLPEVFPPRHGREAPYPENSMWEVGEALEYSMPFHPACFELFKRASKMRSGEVDVEGLTEWWTSEATLKRFIAFPRESDVSRAHRQWWEHHFGSEYLAANPCFVPGLEELFAKTQRHRSAHGDCQLVFPGVFETATPGDPFSRLPPEIKTLVLHHLRSADVPALCLASRAFRQLPQVVYRDFVLRDLSWLYEVSMDMPFSYWATATAEEVKKEDSNKRLRAAHLRVAMLQIEEDREEHGETAENEAAFLILGQQVRDLEASIKVLNRSVPAFSVCDGNINWYNLDRAVVKNIDKLPGLKNRRRIWRDCNEILDRIERLRGEGRIGMGIKIDPLKTVEGATDENDPDDPEIENMRY